MLFSTHELELQHFLSSALSFWFEPAAASAAAVEAAEQPNDIAVVFMVLFGCYFTFEVGDMAAATTLGGGCKLNG